jgi:high-affinity iron transporter
LFGGSGQEYFNAGVLSFAVLMLGWHNVWMARHGREMALEARELGRAISSGEKK